MHPEIRRVGLLVAACLCAPQAQGAAEGERPSSPVRVGPPLTARIVTQALEGARQRLLRPECGRILDEFRDAAGRPLSAELVRLGLSGPAYLGTMLFYDGAPLDLCRTGATLAVAHPGQRIVFVCADRFVTAATSDFHLGEAILIHEMLHSLGLGENPPSSREITARVMRSCER